MNNEEEILVHDETAANWSNDMNQENEIVVYDVTEQTVDNQQRYKNIGETSCPSKITLCMDLSISMGATTNDGKTLHDKQLEAVGDAIGTLIENCSSSSGKLKDRVHLGILGITDGKPESILGFAPISKHCDGSSDIQLPASPSYGGTDHETCLNTVYEIFQNSHDLSTGTRKSSFNVCVIISDGEHNMSSRERAIQAAERVKSLPAEDGISPTLIVPVFITSTANDNADLLDYKGFMASELIDQDERLMAEIASEVPEEMLSQRLSDITPNLRRGSKLMFKGGPDVMKAALSFIAEASSMRQ